MPTRLAVRQERSVKLLAELKTFLETNLERISRKGDLAKAFRYCLNRRAALSRFTLDVRLEMSNNAAERAIRPLTLGRRNSAFLGSDTGGTRTAVFFYHTQIGQTQRHQPRSLSHRHHRPHR